MNKKDSKSLGNNVPQIVLHFQDSYKRILKKSIYITGDKTLQRFKALEKRLHKQEISISEYADYCMLFSKEWIKRHDVEYVPLTLFTGGWMFDKYVRLKSKDIKLQHKDEQTDNTLYEDEYLVSVEYIRCKLDGRSDIRFMEVVEELEDVLSEEWKSLYMDSKYRDSQLKVLNELELYYNVQAISLNDLVNKLKENGNY